MSRAGLKPRKQAWLKLKNLRLSSSIVAWKLVNIYWNVYGYSHHESGPTFVHKLIVVVFIVSCEKGSFKGLSFVFSYSYAHGAWFLYIYVFELYWV